MARMIDFMFTCIDKYMGDSLVMLTLGVAKCEKLKCVTTNCNKHFLFCSVYRDKYEQISLQETHPKIFDRNFCNKLFEKPHYCHVTLKIRIKMKHHYFMMELLWSM